MHAIVSIHDVSPSSLERVESIIRALPKPCHKHLILLVIPGLEWSEEQINTLKQWQDKGYILAGHGWRHKCLKFGGLYHRIHSLFISRDVAEHLALNGAEIDDLLKKNHAWFCYKKLNPPDYYVPPAWAMGSISRTLLAKSSFQYFETGSAIFDARTNTKKHLPLVGFEADTTFRACFLKLWNAFNIALTTPKRPLRISIHPKDMEYKIADSIHRILGKVSETRSIKSLFE